MDAWGALNASFGNLWKATAEINESLFPHVQWSRDYRTDSGGAGEWRGICGSHYEKEVRVDATVYTYVVGMKYPMPGICGGADGSDRRLGSRNQPSSQSSSARDGRRTTRSRRRKGRLRPATLYQVR